MKAYKKRRITDTVFFTRFGAPATPENLARADAWADAAIQATLPHIYEGFGAVQLMILLLAQHYDLNRGRFTSAWMLMANCTRMMQLMSLHTFDRTYKHMIGGDGTRNGGNGSQLPLSPLLTNEALRRAAWSTFYADSVTDAGRYGFHTVDSLFYRIQLPCHPRDFEDDIPVVTQSLFPEHENSASNTSESNTDMDMAGYLIRIAAVRRRALHFAFRASHADAPFHQLAEELTDIETQIENTVRSLPVHLACNYENRQKYRRENRLMTFLMMHILRHNLYIVAGRATLLVYRLPSTETSTVAGDRKHAADIQDRITAVRRSRVAHALPVAGLVANGIEVGLHFDPHVGVQAYVALESMPFLRTKTYIDNRWTESVANN